MIVKTFIEKYKHGFPPRNRKLVSDFFVIFSRFEFSLKETIIFACGNNGKVKPNWDGFVAKIRDSFDKEKTRELKEAVDFLFVKPPKIQSLLDGRLIWIDREFQSNTPEINKISLHIRDIRNNLFHGSKFDISYEEDGSRNCQLLISAIIILNDWLELNEDVKLKFLEHFT